MEQDRVTGRTGYVTVGGLLLAAMLVAQVASGLQPAPVRLTSVVVLLLSACAVAFAAADHGAARAVGAFCAAAGAGYVAEWVGVRTGVPFGEYAYTGVLWPAPGGVPVIVALAWGGMGLAAYAVASRVARSFWGVAATGAFALTAWDLFLDPQMLRLGLWDWVADGPYRGVPVSNFVGWLVVSFLVMALIGRVLGRQATGNGTGLVLLYTVMAVMETIGFAAVFDPPDLVVAVAGGAAMGLFTVLAWTRRTRSVVTGRADDGSPTPGGSSGSDGRSSRSAEAPPLSPDALGFSPDGTPIPADWPFPDPPPPLPDEPHPFPDGRHLWRK